MAADCFHHSMGFLTAKLCSMSKQRLKHLNATTTGLLRDRKGTLALKNKALLPLHKFEVLLQQHFCVSSGTAQTIRNGTCPYQTEIIS